MNQGFKKLLPAILSGVAILCSLISFIFLFIFKGSDAWDYINSILIMLSIGGLLALAILKLVNVNINKMVYIAPLAGIALASLLRGLESLMDIGSSSYYRYSYFNAFINSLITIAAIALFIFAVYKKNTVIASVSLTYLAADFFVSGLNGFIRMIFSLFTKDLFKYGFNTFVSCSASFLFFATYAFLAYEYFKNDNQ